MSRRDEQEHEISIGSISQRIGSPGITITMSDIHVENMSNVRVTKLAAGEQFRVKLNYNAQWLDKPTLILNWVISFTAVGTGVAVYDNENVGNRTTYTGTAVLDNPSPAVMPNQAVSLKIQAWASEKTTDYYYTPPTPW